MQRSNQMENNIIYWNIKEQSKNLEGMEDINLQLAIEYALRFVKTYEEIINKIQLSNECKIKGKIIELGAGFGVMSSILSKRKDIIKISCVEYSMNLLTNVMSIIFKRLCANVDKIERIRGSFNDLKFDDNTFDFAIETLAFHHSDDLQQTLNETYRVLRGGGINYD